MATKKVTINRAPVLTLWATVVAERLGYDHEAALTLGKGVAGLNAQSKGRRLGIFEESKESKEKKEPKTRQSGEEYLATVLGRPVPVVETGQGVRATIKGKPIDPASVKHYLENKFGDDLPAVQAAMEDLAKAYKPNQLATQAYELYEQFRPDIPEGKKGWGAKGELDLDYIRTLAK
jgi:hypothetical protein